MQDLHKRVMYKKLGWMQSIKCPCCNWTIQKNHNKQNRRVVHKQVRAELKQRLRNNNE